MLILHGENTVQSRNRLFQLTSDARKKGELVVHVEIKQLDFPTLEDAFGNQNLFGESKFVVIEELHSLIKSKRKDELITFVGNFAAQTNDGGLQIVLWEKRALTPTMLKKFPGAKSEEFKITNSLFKWLDSIGVASSAQNAKLTSLKLLRDALEKDGDFMCFTMFIRQIRLLIQVKDGAVAGLPPFMIGKLKQQAGAFTMPQLLKMHGRLLELDIEQKTSTSRLNLTQQLELLTIEM